MCELNKLDDIIKKSNDSIHYDPSDELTEESIKNISKITKSGNGYTETENDDNTTSYDSSSEDGTESKDSTISTEDKTKRLSQQNNIYDRSKISEPHKPKISYVEFMMKEIKIQYEKNPGLKNKDYMTLASTEWAKNKNNLTGHDSSDKSMKENNDSFEKSYQEFVAQETIRIIFFLAKKNGL